MKQTPFRLNGGTDNRRRRPVSHTPNSLQERRARTMEILDDVLGLLQEDIVLMNGSQAKLPSRRLPSSSTDAIRRDDGPGMDEEMAADDQDTSPRPRQES